MIKRIFIIYFSFQGLRESFLNLTGMNCKCNHPYDEGSKTQKCLAMLLWQTKASFFTEENSASYFMRNNRDQESMFTPMLSTRQAFMQLLK